MKKFLMCIVVAALVLAVRAQVHVGGTSGPNTNALTAGQQLILNTAAGTNEVSRQAWHQPTNAWSGTAFLLGQRSTIVSATNIYLLSCSAPGTVDGTWGQLTIRATANLTVTNHPNFHASDFLVSRVLTNGQTLALVADMEPGQYTNLFITQCK
jgi:hypothetical protein